MTTAMTPRGKEPGNRPSMGKDTMTESGDWRQRLVPKIADQVDHIAGEFRGAGTEIGVVAAGDGISHLHAEGHLLVRDEHVGSVREILRQPARDDLIRRVTPGVVRLSLSDGEDGSPQPAVADVLDRLDERIGAGNATPDHVITVAQGVVSLCPATEPLEAYPGTEPFPSPRPGNDGAGVLVYVADTGLLPDAAEDHPWLAGVTGDPDPLPRVGRNGIQKIPPYAGHGTFVAGVVRCMAPAADVYVSNIFNKAGSTLESDLIPDLDRALQRGADLFNLSIATPTRSDLPLLAFDEWLRRLSRYKGVACVVAAGNDGSRRPSWPAAFPEMIAVGALTADGQARARFSNYGGWVDVYAPGRDHVNAYATGSYTCHERPFKGQVRCFHGMARWSGTSFSTPVVTGLIAARMSRTGENGQQAVQALLAEARSRAIPGLGPILLP